MTTTSPQKSAPDLIQVTDVALEQVKILLEEERQTKPDVSGLRLGVTGGGCSGFSYKIAFDAATEKDYIVPLDGVNVYIDPKSAIYLKGIILDYQGGLEGKGFVFRNPNATSVCGCGESFSV